MTEGLKRYQRNRELHFVTFSCYKRRPFLNSASSRDLFENALERMRIRYDFFVNGYVVMPEHVHLLLSEPQQAVLAVALQAVKLSVSRRASQRPFWQARYYDFNVYTEHKRIEKLRYIHRNPVTRGLVDKRDEWKWSSFQHYLTGEQRTVEIEDMR
jgi:putative transposase